MQTGQALLHATNKATLATAERSRYCKEIKVEREKVKALEQQLKVAKARTGELEKERDGALDKAKVAERELGRMQRREKRKMKEVDAKAYQAEFDRAGAEYKREARKTVNEELILRVPIAYRTGYKDGVAATAGVL